MSAPIRSLGGIIRRTYDERIYHSSHAFAMELRQLRSFIAVAEELHFQRAARRVNLSQPALSHQIKALEQETGVTLFDRDRRSVAITRAGQAFLVRAREAVTAVDAALREAREAAGAEPSELRIGSVSYLNLRVVSRSIAALRGERPALEVQQTEMPTAEVYAALKEGQIDIGFGVLPVTHPTLKSRLVAEGHWSVVVSAEHGLRDAIEGDVLPLSAMAGYPMVMFERSLNPPLYDAWMARFRAAGIAPKIVLETNQVQTGLDMARDGAATFLVASYIVEPVPPDLVRLRLGGFENRIAIGAAWHEDNKTALLADYLRHLRAALAA
ncbi:MAG: LysR family transcriptional regulator [Pseudomonadota bacterium]